MTRGELHHTVHKTDEKNKPPKNNLFYRLLLLRQEIGRKLSDKKRKAIWKNKKHLEKDTDLAVK